MTKLAKRKRPPRRISLNGKPYNYKETEPDLRAPKGAKRLPIRTEDGLYNEVAAANFLGLSVSTLQNRRSSNEPPEYVKRGRRVFYKLGVLTEYRDRRDQ